MKNLVKEDKEFLIRTYPYQLFPTKKQEYLLEEMKNLHCDLYNICLHSDQYEWEHNKKGLNWAELSRLRVPRARKVFEICE